MEIAKQEIMTMEAQVLPLMVQAEKYEIISDEAVDEASAFLKKVRDTEKLIETKRLEFTAPLNQSLKALNSTFKKLREPLDEVKQLVSDKILAWRRVEAERVRKEEEVRRKEEEERTREVQEAFKAEADSKDKQEVIEEIIKEEEELKPVIEQPKNKIGNVQTRKVWTYKVIDNDKVPGKYTAVVPVIVNQAIRDGVRDIPGLEIYQEEKLSIVNR